jgi:hypothetical protein
MKKLLMIACLISTIPCFASTPVSSSSSSDYCSQLSGVWEGTYQDPSGLFASKAFPIRLALQSSNGFVYGYTLKSNDGKLGAKFGTQHWLVYGSCSNNTISNLYFINPNNKPACGDAAQKVSPLTQAGSMTLYIPWENAMTSTTFTGSLKQVMNKFEINQGLIDAARQMSKTKINSCQ